MEENETYSTRSKIISEKHNFMEQSLDSFQNSPINWSKWKTKGIETINDLVTGSTFISMTEFKSNFRLTNVDSLKYMQLKSSIS
jgi:hypothetical protein